MAFPLTQEGTARIPNKRQMNLLPSLNNCVKREMQVVRQKDAISENETKGRRICLIN
jgi:hypothetical protein